MKHYLCFEENQISYVGGRLTSEGFRIKRAAREALPDAEMEQVLRRFVKKNRIKGKKVTLSLDSGIIFHEYRLPAVKESELRGMVRSELAYSTQNPDDYTISVMPYKKADDGGIMVLVHAIREEELVQKMEALRDTGIRCRHVRVHADCMGSLAARQYPENKMLLLTEIDRDQIRMFLIENGCCVLSRSQRLNVTRFLDGDSLNLLCEEAVDQISQVVQFHTGRNKKDPIEKIVLVSDVITRLDTAAGWIGESMRMVCEPVNWKIFPSNKTKEEEIVSCFKGMAAMAVRSRNEPKNVDFLQDRIFKIRRERKKGFFSWTVQSALLFAVSLFAVGGVWYAMSQKSAECVARTEQLTAYVEESERLAQYDRIMSQQEELSRLQAYNMKLDSTEAMIRSNNLLDYRSYLGMVSPVPEGVAVESMLYQQGILSLKLKSGDPRYVPGYVKAVEESGALMDTWHQIWSEDEDVNGGTAFFADIYGVPEGGTALESQPEEKTDEAE